MHIKIYRRFLVWRIALIGGNGEMIMHSEAYYSESNARREANKLARELDLEVL